MALFAQVLGSTPLAQVAITIVIVAALVALVVLALRSFGLTIPPIVVQMFMVVGMAVLAIFLILLLARLAGTL